MAKAFSKDEVSSHSKPDNLWVVIDEDVFDLTQFQEEHPGGKKSMLFVGQGYIQACRED